MEFLLYDEVYKQVYKEEGFIKTPDISKGTRLFRLLMRLDGAVSHDICTLLNKLNDQGIEEINCKAWYYVRNGSERLPLTCLSTGETLYLAAFAGDSLHVPVYLYLGLRQLTRNSLKTLIKTYYRSSYVNLLCDSESQRDLYEIIKGECVC